VLRYRAFRDVLRFAIQQYGELPDDGWSLVMHMQMPGSWSRKRMLLMAGSPCLAKPDIDNCWKAFTDALFDNDSGIWRMRAEKRYAMEPGFTIIFDDGVGWI